MPERVIAHLENEVKKKKGGEGVISMSQLEAEAPEESEDVLRVVKKHAKRFVQHYKEEGLSPEERSQRSKKRRIRLLSQNGSVQTDGVSEERSHVSTESGDHDFDDEENIADELIQRWKESEWGKAWRHRRAKKKGLDMSLSSGHWIGGSFEVGTLLGVNLLNPPTETQPRAVSIKHTPSDENPNLPSTSRSVKSAPERSGPAFSLGSHSLNLPDDNRSLRSNIDSSTGLLAVPKLSPIHTDPKGKQRAVHYAEPPPELHVEPPPPVSPQVVLSRTESELDPTSSQAAMFSPVLSSPGALNWGDVLMRDRMLVRVAYSKLEALSTKFDDSIHRTTRGLQYEACAEFMVVWRKDLIELYEDHSTPGKEMLVGRKHLAYVIPLKSSRTNLSLYSFVDLTFCLTCPPTSTRVTQAGGSRRIFNRAKEGTNIFIFKHKTRSRAWDWTWQLWRYLGGQLPPTIEIHNPKMNSTVTIDIPYRLQIDNQELYAMFTRENLVELCMESLSKVPDWFSLVEHEITEQGKRLELCWRRDAHLDWLWMDEDVYGKSRPWATLAGLAVKQSSRPASLEIRLTSHAPTHYHLKNDTKIEEPPSIEGYVERIRPNTQTKQALYLSTHCSLLFINHTHEANPPLPPGLALTTQDLDSWVRGLHAGELLRGANQGVPSCASGRAPGAGTPEDMWSTEEVCTLDDDEDEGGEQILPTQDRSIVKMRRCFELLLNTGQVIRFEVHSRKVAIEWVNRLRALVVFWKYKRRINAKEEIELAQARRPRLTPQIRVCQKEEYPPEPPADMSAPYSAMDNLYNWCIIDGCSPITKVSKLHMRKGLRGQYKLMSVALVAGHLVRFRIKPNSAMHMGGAKKINLLDAYVISGYFAAMNLPSGQFKANAPSAPRRYLDGLETDDRDEDMLFMLWYRPHPPATDAAKAPTIAATPSKSVPRLSAKHKMLVFRTRSRIERDAWCWALTTEIEKIARVQTEREVKLRDTGNLIDLSK
ncbi:hypothetical protein D9611_008762 [Ephemerocybe angulata]|uniref:PH domain-containing protein n=1 Tax=Ephemerocybe angulata TaxID=980116 RepID=A0A8H5FJB3_9AGAR|nr:hypothetical protein D9611_008762 [Tulosesus angulatus]